MLKLNINVHERHPTSPSLIPLPRHPCTKSFFFMANQWPSPLLIFFCSFPLSLFFLTHPTTSDPQTQLITIGCSERNATDLPTSSSNIALVLSDMRRNVSSSSRFASAQRNQGSEPVYGVFQCREYLSSTDCLACFTTAAARVRSHCPLSDGSSVHYDGCFLRYENDFVYDDSTSPSRVGSCEEREVNASKVMFNSTTLRILSGLVEVVPMRDRFFAAAKMGEEGAGSAVYGVGQCVLTISRSDCTSCLRLAYENIRGCPPASGARAVDVGCFLRYSDQGFFNDSQVVDLDRFIQNTGGSKQGKAIVIASAGAGGAVVILSVLILVIFLRRSRQSRMTSSYVTMVGLTELRGPASFAYNDLKHATDNFSDKNKLGQGGFAAVYKGVLRTGKTVAVKKLKISETIQAREEFETELTLISNINHRNLLPLLGCCRKGPHLLFVYEYMEKGSLDRYLFGDKHGSLSWIQRFNIILGAARGLAYLHEEYYVRIIHRDVKSGNILLGNEFQPKIADFGLARLLPQDRSHVSTRLAGTLGYAAPEYVLNGHLSEKVDTYSFGIVVLEILSGLRCSHIRIEPVTMYLLEWGWRLYESDSLLEMVDKSLDSSTYKEEEVKRVAEIGLMCTQSAALRPSMSEVVALLMNKEEYKRVELVRPSTVGEPTNRPTPVDNASSTQSSNSNAVMTISHFSAR